MSFQRTSSALGFGWQDVMRLNRKAKTTNYKIKDLERALLYWVGPGAMLNRKAAENLRDHFQKSIATQKDISAGGGIFKDLTPNWRFKKWKFELPGYEKMAIAYGEMANSIEAIDSGGGKWKVGIKKTGKLKKSLNATKLTLSTVAEIFEMGSVKQQARPIFMHYFLEWVEVHVNEVLEPVMKAFSAKYKALKGDWEGTNYDFVDMLSDVKEVKMGVGKASQYTTGQDTTADTAIDQADEDTDLPMEDLGWLGSVREEGDEGVALEDDLAAVDPSYLQDLSLSKYESLVKAYANEAIRFFNVTGKDPVKAESLNKVAWDADTKKYYIMRDFFKMLEMRATLRGMGLL